MWIGPGSTFGLLLVLIAVYALIARREYRQKQSDLWAQIGMCAQCGYDLRKSFERCPECGAPIPEPLARRRRLRALACKGVQLVR
jgi:hypothetical protein